MSTRHAVRRATAASASLAEVHARKFDQSIPRKSLKLLPPDVIFKTKCTKFDFGWSSVPNPAGELTSPLEHLAGFEGAYFF